jgi:hypothetical protein
MKFVKDILKYLGGICLGGAVAVAVARWWPGKKALAAVSWSGCLYLLATGAVTLMLSIWCSSPRDYRMVDRLGLTGDLIFGYGIQSGRN